MTPGLEVSPDGRSVMVPGASAPPAVARILVVAADGSDARELSGPYPLGTSTPLWTPDGQAILCGYQHDNAPWRLMQIPLAGGSPVSPGSLSRC